MATAMERLSFLQPSVAKMSKPFVSLCPEVTRSDALALMHWLEDDAVVRYLSDSRDVSRTIERAIDRVHMPILTHLFNQGGRFFMAYDRHDRPVGFVRLVPSGPDCEMVLVIGDRENWGRRLGGSAIAEGMKRAFFDLRAERLIAKIHTENTRSLNAFLRCGFEPESETPTTLHSFSVTAERYLKLLRDRTLGGRGDIHIPEIDKARLMELLFVQEQGNMAMAMAVVELEHELERAIVVEPQRVARNVVTMNSRALVRLDEVPVEVALVYPGDADESAGKLSVCSDVGAAILGFREGDCVDWRVDGRTRRIRVERVVYQPEAAGDFHL